MLVCSTKTSQSSSGNKRLKKSYGSDSVTWRVTGPCCPPKSGNETTTSSSRFPHLTVETSALPRITGDRDGSLLVVVPRTLPPCGLPRLLPLDLPLVDVVVSFHRASPSLSLDWSSELSLCSIALSELSESSESELGSNIWLASSPSSPSKSEISLSQSCELLPQCNILFFSQPCCYPSADVLAILSEKWLNGRLKCKDWFTYAISKYPSGHLNRKFEEK